MTQHSHPISHSLHHAIPLLRDRSWRETAAEEADLISTWYSSWLAQGFVWFLQLGVPTAATVLEIRNMKSRIPNVGAIEQSPISSVDL